MPLLIITSLEEELALLTQSLRAQGFSESMQAVGKLTGHCFPTLGVTLALGGHGKAQAALQTQHAIDQSERIDLVICAGAAGALVPGIAVGDLVVAETTIEHDYLLRFVERPAPQFAGCQETLNRLRSSYYTQHPARVHYGIIASGDEDIVALERAQALHVQTEALAVAWEGAGVARACRFSGISSLEIRGITDTADHDAPAVLRRTCVLRWRTWQVSCSGDSGVIEGIFRRNPLAKREMRSVDEAQTVREGERHMSQATPPSQPAMPPETRARRELPRPPGPPWYTAVSNTVTFARQTLSFLRELRERYGDLVTLPTVVGPWILVFHPDGVRHVVQENHFNYRKGGISHQTLRLTLGNGLLTNNGDSWLHQRRLIQPIFHRERIAAMGRLMTESAASWIEAINIETQQPLDLFPQMSGLTLDIVCQALCGADMLEYKERVFQASSAINHLDAQALYMPGLLFLPTPQRHRLYEARNTVYAIVDTLIAKRRQASTENDLLTMLLRAQDEETGEGMTNEQVRDEVVTLLAAGQETTANALCWTLVLLSQHPDIEARLREEYTRVLGGRAPQVEDLPQLKLSRMVLEESMRLYPPAWAFARSAIDEDEIGGHTISKGAYVLVFPATTHRHPDFWEQPDVFDPERFSPERSAGRHRFAYFPFGGGPRVCIGNQFALTEAQLILATILPRYQFRLLPGVEMVPEPLITLRPRGKLLMTISRQGG